MDVLLILGAYLIGSTAFAIFVGKAIARRDAPLAGDHWRFGSGSRARRTRAGGISTSPPVCRAHLIARRVPRLLLPVLYTCPRAPALRTPTEMSG